MPPETFKVRLAANLGGLELARLQMRQHLLSHGIEPASVAAVELLVEEYVTNTLRYGYEDTGLRWVDISLEIEDAVIDIVIEDDAGAFDPIAAVTAALPTSLDEAGVGGLGLTMIQKSAQSLAYERVGGRNRLNARVARRR